MGLRVLLVAAAAALLSAAAQSGARAQDILPFESAGNANAALRVLSSQDVQRYREIFKDERDGHFADARANIARLSDTSLMGYVLAEHYLSPHSGRTKLVDLNDWLRRYGDLSIADRIQDLAHMRARHRRHASVEDIPGYRWRGGGYEDVDLPDPPMSAPASRKAQIQIEHMISDGQPVEAQAILTQLSSSPDANATDVARLTVRVAASYLAENMVQQAYDVASPVAGNAAAPLIDWEAGFAAYRLGKYADAATDLERLAQNGSVPSWTRSAAAFWAARAHIQDGTPLRVVTLLMAAAREQPTFYGLLAARILGEDTDPGFTDPVMSTDNFLQLMKNPAAHRAVALWQVGRDDDVPNEMNRAFAGVDYQMGGTFAALARAMNLPNIELRASETAASRGVMLTGLFPVPKYAPDGGYRIDPSLVLAFARIESRFRSDAVSPAGARGLMQLMPSTARLLGGGDLDDPSKNLALGQRYIEQLLTQVNGNLLELAAAYNSGPGNISRWLSARPECGTDPLLFVETIPMPETRAYVKKLMTYHWLYRRRFNQDVPALDETAKGQWPVYRPQDVPVAGLPRAVQSFHAAATN